MTKKKELAKQDSGSDGPAISDVIEIKPGESLLGADLEPLAHSGDGWLSIANRSDASIYLHITKDSILLSLRDLSGRESSDGNVLDESSEIHPPSSDSDVEKQPSASSTP